MLEELVVAVKKVMSGGKFVTSGFAEMLASALRAGASEQAHRRLSNRELEILRRVVSGRTIKEIGLELNLSPKTVTTYRSRIYEKLNVRNDVEMTRYAFKHGLLN